MINKQVTFVLTLITLALSTSAQAQSCTASNGKPCIFPFVYLGTTFDKCTTLYNSKIYWCSTSNKDGTNEMEDHGLCTDTCPKEDTPHPSAECETENGNYCHYPFKYNGVTYTGCTTVGFNETYWCSINNNPDGTVNLYEECKAHCPRHSTVAENACGTINKNPCVFPFVYKGVTYDHCIDAENYGKLWCPTKINATTMETEEFENCNNYCPTPGPSSTTTTTISTTPGPSSTTTTSEITSCPTADGKTCVFPFVYLGTTFDKCTTLYNSKIYWCSTSNKDGTNEMEDHGLCTDTCPKEDTPHPSAECETESGNYCHYPFKYNGVTYTGCTTVDFNNTYWCSINNNPDGSVNLYEKCKSHCPRHSTVAENACGTINKNPCVFPFVYKGVTYDHCIDAENNGKLWCPTKINATTMETEEFENCNNYCATPGPSSTTTTTISTTPELTSTTTTTLGTTGSKANKGSKGRRRRNIISHV